MSASAARRSLGRRILRAVLTVAALLALGVGYLAWKSWTYTNIGHYSGYLARWSEELGGHFPRHWAAEGEGARFSYFPGFLQGGAHIQLRLAVAPEVVAHREVHYARRAIQVVDLASAEASDPGLPQPPFYTSSIGRALSFPPRFTLYYLVARPGTTRGFPWNHGRTAGVAISRQPPEIVYWAERW